MARKEKKWTDVSTLTEAWRIARSYNGPPRDPLDQLKLIESIYGNTIRGKPLTEMPQKQLFSIANSVYNRALRFIKDQRFSSDETSILEKLSRFEEILKERSKYTPLSRIPELPENLERNIEDLEERIAIQLEGLNIPNNSQVTREYMRLQDTYRRVA